jgi:hypothetical protein
MKGGAWIILLSCAFVGAALFGLQGNGGAGLLSMLLAAVLGLICVVAGVLRLLKLPKPPGLNSVAVALLPLAAVALIFFRVDAMIVSALKSRVIFAGTCEHTVTFVHLVLREDGSCEFEPGSFLDRNWQSGEWHRSGDTVHVGIEEARNTDPMKMELLITGEGLRELSKDTLHAHGFAGTTDRIRVATANTN